MLSFAIDVLVEIMGMLVINVRKNCGELIM